MTVAIEVTWRWQSWRDLDPDTLYAALKLRSDVFVVEQNCVYSDVDGLDPQCDHLCGVDQQGRLLAYLRLLPPGVKYPEPSIGRVVVARDARKHGLARKAMFDGIKRCRERFPNQPILIQAQQYLEQFYESLGFRSIGAPYLEDGISHVDMRMS